MWSQMLFILHPKKWPTWIWCRSSGYLGFPTGDGANFELPTFQPGLLLWSLVNMVGKCGKNMENDCFFFQRCRNLRSFVALKLPYLGVSSTLRRASKSIVRTSFFFDKKCHSTSAPASQVSFAFCCGAFVSTRSSAVSPCPWPLPVRFPGRKRRFSKRERSTGQLWEGGLRDQFLDQGSGIHMGFEWFWMDLIKNCTTPTWKKHGWLMYIYVHK